MAFLLPKVGIYTISVVKYQLYIYILVGGFKHFLFSISYMGCHPNPIDEVYHFSRCLLHHQPELLTVSYR